MVDYLILSNFIFLLSLWVLIGIISYYFYIKPKFIIKEAPPEPLEKQLNELIQNAFVELLNAEETTKYFSNITANSIVPILTSEHFKDLIQNIIKDAIGQIPFFGSKNETLTEDDQKEIDAATGIVLNRGIEAFAQANPVIINMLQRFYPEFEDNLKTNPKKALATLNQLQQSGMMDLALHLQGQAKDFLTNTVQSIIPKKGNLLPSANQNNSNW